MLDTSWLELMPARRTEELLAPHWHALSVESVFRRLRTSRAGLSSSEAARRLAAAGPNRSPVLLLRFFQPGFEASTAVSKRRTT
jgi:hypothetical protein